MKKTSVLAFGLVAATALTSPAKADKLDDIISSGTLRCAVVLDFPPMGSRDENNNPIGFDVDYCNDLAKALGVTAEIVETPFPERIPALMSGRVDVGVASTSDTLERAKTVGATAGTFEAIALEKSVKEWGAGEFRPYQTQADVFLALSQGQIDATVSTSTVAQSNVKSGKFAGISVVGMAPYDIDYVSLFTNREEYGLINYLNLFINQQVRTGRYAELYEKWVGGDLPSLSVNGVYR